MKKLNAVVIQLRNQEQIKISKSSSGKGYDISHIHQYTNGNDKHIYLTNQEFEDFAKTVAFVRSMSK